jgi:hypothetical protein
MKVITKYVADDGREFDSQSECERHEAHLQQTAARAADLERRHREDFDLMVLCELKGDPAMYQLLRDRTL